jgi:hypothetical protein
VCCPLGATGLACPGGPPVLSVCWLPRPVTGGNEGEVPACQAGLHFSAGLGSVWLDFPPRHARDVSVCLVPLRQAACQVWLESNAGTPRLGPGVRLGAWDRQPRQPCPSYQSDRAILSIASCAIPVILTTLTSTSKITQYSRHHGTQSGKDSLEL